MPENRARALLTCFVAIVMVVGFTAAPVAAVDDGLTVEDDEVTVGDDNQGITVEEDGVEIRTGDDDSDAVDGGDDDDTQGDSSETPADLSDAPVPEEVCTDAGDTIQEEVPVEDVPWLSDLPEEAQPPNVPAQLVTPRTVVAIVAGATPNQCEVQDPNDPSYDPLADGVDPDASATPAQGDYKDGVWGLVVYEATVDQSGSGPSASGMIWTLGSSEDGTVDPQVTINDGEKDYAINPSVGYGSDGTAKADIEAWAINRRAGTGVDCDGEECESDASGVPATNAPALPAPTGQDGDDDSSQSDNEFPEEVCTDVPEEFHDNVPWNDLPWIDDLPEEAQPPNVPAQLVTPRTVSSIVVGVTPNQCDVQDPNDPSYDPREDDVDPDASATPAQGDYKDGSWGLVVYEATLDQSGDGPGIEGMIWTFGSTEDGRLDADVTINDGEKDYAVNPEIGYRDDGTGDGELQVRAIGKGASTGMECDGEECQPDASGLPAVDAPAVPAPTGQDDEDDDSEQADGEFPQEICTDVGGEVHGEVPWDELPWFDELPEDAQPPGIVSSILHPKSVSALVVGTAPDHCDVQDPNDPSYDPREDDVDPDASVTPTQGEAGDGYWGLLIAEATLDQSGDGPGVDGMIWTVGTTEYGTVDVDVTLNDGEKDYAVNPEIGFRGDGTGQADIEIRALKKGASIGLVCDGEECRPDASGAPGTNALAIPAPTGQDDGGDNDSDDSDDSGDDSGSNTDGDDGSSGSSDSTDSDGTTDTQTSVGGAGTAGGSGGQAAGGSDDGSDGSSDGTDATGDADEDTSSETDGAEDSADGESDDEYESEPADEPVRSAAESDADGAGFGVVLAGLSVLFATLMTRRLS